MNSLVKIGLALNLNQDERFIVKSSWGDRIKDISDKDLKIKLSEIIGKAFFECGQQTPENPIIIGMANTLFNDLHLYFSGLTLGDVQASFHFGVRKHFGDFFGLNNVTFFGWIKSYHSWEVRREAKRKQNQHVYDCNQHDGQLTQQEKEKIMWDAIEKAYKEISEGKFYDDPGNSVYTFLDKRKKLPFTLERKKQFLSQAFNDIIADKSQTSEVSDLNVARKLKEEIRLLNEKSFDVIVRAKKLAINTFIKEQTELGLTVSDLKT